MRTVGIQTPKGARFLAGNSPAHLRVAKETITYLNQIVPLRFFWKELSEGANSKLPKRFISILRGSVWITQGE